MKKIFYLLSISFLLLQSCSPEDKSMPPAVVVKDDIKPPFTIKYEILFSKPTFEQAMVEYTTDNNLYVPYVDYIPSKTTSWTKTIVTNLAINPYHADLSSFSKFSEDATVTFNIYVNKTLYHHYTYERKSVYGINQTEGYGTTAVIY